MSCPRRYNAVVMSVKRTRTGGKRPPRERLSGRFSSRLSEGRGQGAGFFFQLVASLADYAVITTDRDGVINSWNPGAKQVFGFSESEIIGQPYSVLFSKEEQTSGAHRRELDTAAKEGRALDETWHVRKDGSRFWAAGVVFPLRDQNGALRGFTKIAQDLTRGKLLEQAAEFTARVLHTVADSIPALVWYISEDERVLFQNRPKLDWWHKKPAEVENQLIGDVLGEEAHQAIHPFVRKCMAGGPVSFETRFPVAEGRWIHADAIPDLDPEGRARGVVLMITDITHARELEKELRESSAAKDRLAAIVSTSADAIASQDLDGNIRTWNEGAERIFGYRANEIIGKPMTTIIPPDRLSEEHEILRRLHEGKPYERRDTVRLTKDRREVHVSISAWPIRDREGRVKESASILRDITERKESERRLRMALERYNLAVEGAGIGTWELLPRGGRPEDAELQWSELQPTLWGLPAGTGPKSARDATDRIHPEDRARVLEAMSDTIARGVDYRVEFRVLWPDGSVHWLAGIARAVRDASGRVVRVIGINIDVTPRKKAEEQVSQAMGRLEEKVSERTEELRGTVDELERFTYTVAHDLRAPLRNVHHHVDRLRRKWRDMGGDAVERDLDNIAAGAKRMDRLIADLLNYSRISSAKLTLAPQDLNAAIGSVLRSLEGEIAERRAVVTVEPSLPRAVADDFLLTQAVTNVLTNALKFVPPDRAPQVRIGAEKKGARVVLWVHDNGIGVDPKYQDKVFGLFERLHPKESYPGAGIGLAIVSRAAQRMGGTVGFESTPGQGSRFWIALKAAPRA